MHREKFDMYAKYLVPPFRSISVDGTNLHVLNQINYNYLLLYGTWLFCDIFRSYFSAPFAEMSITNIYTTSSHGHGMAEFHLVIGACKKKKQIAGILLSNFLLR